MASRFESVSIPSVRRMINYELCIGCYTCEETCNFINEKPYIKLYDVVAGLRRPISCFHCVYAPCVYACPTRAMSKDRDGAVYVDTSRCIGCMACLAACPFGIPEFSSFGTAIKCDLCRPLREKGLEPACVAVCPASAIAWGPPDKIAETFRKRVLQRILSTATKT